MGSDMKKSLITNRTPASSQENAKTTFQEGSNDLTAQYFGGVLDL